MPHLDLEGSLEGDGVGRALAEHKHLVVVALVQQRGDALALGVSARDGGLHLQRQALQARHTRLSRVLLHPVLAPALREPNRNLCQHRRLRRRARGFVRARRTKPTSKKGAT